MSNQNNNSAFQMIADIDGDLKDFLNVSTPEHVPVLALRNMVLFPGVVTPILIGRKSSKTLVEKAEKKAEKASVMIIPMIKEASICAANVSKVLTL